MVYSFSRKPRNPITNEQKKFSEIEIGCAMYIIKSGLTVKRSNKETLYILYLDLSAEIIWKHMHIRHIH